MSEGTIEYLRQKYPAIVIEEAAEPVFQYDVDGPRLIISHIENENFKSYAGTRILGPFHKNFTCIIGPNGSGKSNVIDSMLFVFGFRASKIRSKKLSVLIHKSEYFPNIKSCTVKVHFQFIRPTAENEDGYDVIPDSAFIVSRTAYDDNSSVVKINDRRVSNKEAVEFLKHKGIDLDHNRFLILQGEVESIALMKPKAATQYEDGLLEYLENIIGCHRFKMPLETLFKQLDELCELRNEKLSRVRAAEREKNELESVRNEAVKYLKLCNEIVVRKNIVFQIRFQKQNNLLLSVLDKQTNAKSDLEKIEGEIKQLKELRGEKTQLMKDVELKRKVKTAEYNKCREEINKLEVEDTRLRDNRTHCKDKLEKLNVSIEKQKGKISSFEKVPDESVSRIAELVSEKENLEKMRQKEKVKLSEAQKMLGEESKELQKEIENHCKQVVTEEERLYGQESDLSNKIVEKDLLLKNYQKEEDNRVKLEKQVEEYSAKLIESDKIVDRISVELPSQQQTVVKLKSNIDNTKSQVGSLRTEIHQMQEKIHDRSMNETGNKTLKFLFEQQSLGKLSGVVGRLGDLAHVDPKYDIPISTAVDRLDSIVCEKIDDAQKCVELMKVHKISRTAFIALDKLTRYESLSRQPYKAPLHTQRLFDILKYDDPRYRSVLYFATRNTLVVDNVDIAKQINHSSRERHRMVTLKGEIFESTGAMTGGGKSVMRGRIRLTRTDGNSRQSNTGPLPVTGKQVAERKQLEQTCKEKEEQLHTMNCNISEMEMEYDELQRKIQENDRMLKYHKSNQVHWRKTEQDLKIKLKTSETKIKTLLPDPKKVTELENTISKLEKAYEKDSVQVKKLKTILDDLNEQLQKMSISKLGCIESRLVGIADKLKEKDKLLKNIEKSVVQAKKIVREAEEQLKKDEDTKVTTTESLQDIDKQLNLIIESGKETLALYKRTTEENKELKSIFDKYEAELTKLEDESKGKSQIKNQQLRFVREVEEEVRKFQAEADSVKDSIKALKLYQIPEDCKDQDYSFMELVGASQEEALSSQSMHCSSQLGKSVDKGPTLYKLRTYTPEQLEELNMESISYQNLESELQRQKPKLNAIDEYRQKEELYMMKVDELTAVTEIRDGQRSEIERLKKQRLKEFTAGFNLITGKLKEMYRMITMGGDAELELVDSLDPFSEGIVFSVRPPKKSWKNISNLSGGEKTLSSLALVFALHHFKPTPFYVMDEIDAALDFKNVSIVANYIKDRTKNAQFIIISLRNNMYELADRLVGIYKPFGFSKTTVVNPKMLAPLLGNYVNQQKKDKNSDMNNNNIYTSSQPAPVTVAMEAGTSSADPISIDIDS